MMRRSCVLSLSAIALIFCALPAGAAMPPGTVNYQGVLRDASDKPLTGSYDMTFRFFDALSSGNEILVDAHAASGSGAVTVSNGLFTALLGGGTVTDGAGPGTYTSLADVFRDYGAVWLEITVGAETLSPRIQVQSAPFSLNASNLAGRAASTYVDTSSTRQVKNGTMRFESADPTYAVLDVVADPGSPYAEWAQNGAYVCRLQDGYAGINCNASSYGVLGYGYTGGGYFQSLSNNSWAYAGYGSDGLYAYGDSYGAYAYSGGTGVYASGNNTGVYANGYYGVSGYGNYFGGEGIYGQGYYGVYGSGNSYGLYGTSGYMGVYGSGGTYGTYGYGYYGAYGQGTAFGGYFTDGNAYSYVGDLNSNGIYYKIWGNGTVSFVQNHPERPDQSVMYAAPEGDEVAVYTRGKARLSHGEARVPLGDTFKYVVNPDIGLTAYVTPRGPATGLYVASVTPTEIVVRESGGSSDVEFDWIVWGLRIGYEQMSAVQPKHDYSPVPAAGSTEAFYARNPDLRRYNALERFKSMESPGGGAPDLSRSQALVAAINRFDPNVDGRLEEARRNEAAAAAPKPTADRGAVPPGVPPPVAARPAAASPVAVAVAAPPMALASAPSPAAATPADLQPVAESVRPGDVLVAPAEDAGLLRPGRVAADRLVVGVAKGPSMAREDGTLAAPIAWSGIVPCSVDATYGAIEAGDLLVVSPTPGHAMRAPAAAAPGAVFAKALEPWTSGAGTIRVLVSAR